PRKEPSGSCRALKGASSSSGKGPRTTTGGPTRTRMQSRHGTPSAGAASVGISVASTAMAARAVGSRAEPVIAHSIRVVRAQQPDRRHEHDVDIEQQRPVLYVVEVVVHPLHDLVDGIGLAAPAVDLRPAGHA